jgi:hypothetical protein
MYLPSLLRRNHSRKTTAYGLATIILAVASPLHAATSDGMFAARGVGAQACATFVENVKAEGGQDLRNSFALWISGYISHANRATEGTFDAVPIQDHGALADIAINICAANPDALVETVVNSLMTQLSDGRSTESTELQTLTAEDRSVNIRTDVLQRVQEKLAALDLLEARAADGKPGPKTAEALRRFQADVGLTLTGLPDPATLFILFLAE